jgi:hypothetical protein
MFVVRFTCPYRVGYFFDFFTGLVGFGDELLEVAVAGASRGMSLVALGEPRPVQASQPGPAEKAPLLPEVMSLNPAAALAA